MERRHTQTAVVLGMTGNGLSVARSLGRRRIPVIGLDSAMDQPGMFSRYCRPGVCPDVTREEEKLIDFLIGIGKKNSQKSVLYATSDEYVLAVSRNRQRLAPFFSFSLAKHELIETFLDKRRTYELARAMGLACPQTFIINNKEGIGAISDIVSYPCALKPVYSHIWKHAHGAQKLFVVRSKEEANTLYQKLSDESQEVMIQEIIPGADDAICTLDTYFNNAQQPLAVFTKRKLRQYPIHFGIGSLHVSERREEIITLGISFLTSIGYVGLAGLEFKYDSRDKSFKFIELNPRTLMSGELPIRCGVDLPYIYYRDVIGDGASQGRYFREGVKLVNLELDIASFFHYRKAGEINFIEWIKSFRGKVCHTYFAIDDLRPFIFIALKFGKTIVRKVATIIFKKEHARRMDAGKRHILHLISSNGLFGAEKVMLDIASSMNGNGMQTSVSVLTRKPACDVIAAAESAGIPAHMIPSRGRYDAGAVQRLATIIRENNIDLVHTHNYKSDFIGLRAARRMKIPCIATIHGYVSENGMTRIYETIDRLVVRFFNKVVLVDASLIARFRGAKEKFVVINNGVQVNKSAVAGRRSPGHSEIVIGTVGRLSREKGHEYLIEAFARICKERDGLRLLIVGDGVLRQELTEKCIRLGIKDNVDFTGFQADTAAYYESMDIYVSSSLIEHFPVAVLEAMSHAKAIVATDVGGTKDMIKDGITGLLIKPASADALGSAITTLLDSASRRLSVGTEAQKFVRENYPLSKTVEAYKKVYQEVLA